MTVMIEEVKFCGSMSQEFNITAGIVTIAGLGFTDDDNVKFYIVYTPKSVNECERKQLKTPLTDPEGKVIALTKKKNYFTLMDMEGFTLIALNENPVSQDPPCVVYQHYRG